MKKILFIVFVLVVLLATCLGVHHQKIHLAATVTLPSVTALQSKPKAAPVLLSAKTGKRIPSSLIPIIDPRDPVFSRELKQMTKSNTFYMVFHRPKGGENLTAKQLVGLAYAMAVARLSETSYEAEIASVDDSDPNAIKIVVPPYGDQDHNLRDYLSAVITRDTGNPAFAQSFADSYSDGVNEQGAYQQNIVMTQKTVKGNAGEPIEYVTLDNTTTSWNGAPMTIESAFTKDQMGQYAPFAAFLK